MTDYDKVVKGIEHHLDSKPTCQGCVYLDVWPCLDAILKDALALIREQQKQLKAYERRMPLPEPPKEENDAT